MKNYYYSPFASIFQCSFDSEGAPAPAAPAQAPAPQAPAPVATPQAPAAGTFTQAQVDEQIAAATATSKTESAALLQSLNSWKTHAELTADEGEALNAQIKTLEGQVFSATELASREQNKITNEFTEKLDTVTGERDVWQTRYADASIARSITDAAVEHKACSPSQISAQLRGVTKLTEITDDSGKVTGYKPVVHYPTKDKAGAEVVLQVSASEAVKLMSEDPQHFNLFQGMTKGGLGRNTSGAAGDNSLASLASNPEAYAAERARLRKANK